MMGQKKLPNKFLIAVDKYNDDWDSKSIELKGKLGPGHEAVWQKAVEEYFTNRLNVRYMKPIGLLQQSKPSNKGEGFSIVTIQCSLIEFLESTAQGLIHKLPTIAERKTRVRKTAQYYYYSVDMFKDFLTRKEFGFTPDQAKEFFDDVRNGILHEARTKHAWRILADSPTGKIIELDDNARTLYRNNFQKGFEAFIKWYEGELPKKSKLQKAFITKDGQAFFNCVVFLYVCNRYALKPFGFYKVSEKREIYNSCFWNEACAAMKIKFAGRFTVEEFMAAFNEQVLDCCQPREWKQPQFSTCGIFFCDCWCF